MTKEEIQERIKDIKSKIAENAQLIERKDILQYRIENFDQQSVMEQFRLLKIRLEILILQMRLQLVVQLLSNELTSLLKIL